MSNETVQVLFILFAIAYLLLAAWLYLATKPPTARERLLMHVRNHLHMLSKDDPDSRWLAADPRLTAITVEVSKLSLKPGDILAIKMDLALTMDQKREFTGSVSKIMRNLLPDGVKFGIFWPGVSLQIIESPPAT